MTLSRAGMIANDSLASISTQASIVARNISSAHTPGYTTKNARVATDILGASYVSGVDRATDIALFRSLLQSNSAFGASNAVSEGLANLERSLNISTAPASDSSASSSPAAGISRLRDALQAYSAAPSNPTAANNVLTRASELVNNLNSATTAVQGLRQQADDAISASVTQINETLEKFALVNKNIIAGTAAGADVSDELDQRDQLLATLSKEIGVKTVLRPNNDMVIYTDSGVTLFESMPREVTFQPTQPFTAGTIGKAVYVDGVPVTGGDSQLNLLSGKIVGLTTLRDDLAPKMQSQLDETARGLIVAFAEAPQDNSNAPSLPGLFTFAGATGVPGPTLMPGLASRIIVNPTADPAQGGEINRLRDGGISAPGNPAYVYNTANMPGYSGRILQMIEKLSEPQDFDTAAGLRAQSSILSFANDSVGWIASERQQAEATRSYENALMSQSSQALSNATGVNIDDQMSRMLSIENSYQASARLLSIVNDMYSALFNAIRA